MPVEEVPDQPSVPPIALHEQGGGTAPAAAEGGRIIPVLVCGERAACWARRGRVAAEAVARLHWRFTSS
jgi:hypothetical protein